MYNCWTKSLLAYFTTDASLFEYFFDFFFHSLLSLQISLIRIKQVRDNIRNQRNFYSMIASFFILESYRPVDLTKNSFSKRLDIMIDEIFVHLYLFRRHFLHCWSICFAIRRNFVRGGFDRFFWGHLSNFIHEYTGMMKIVTILWVETSSNEFEWLEQMLTWFACSVRTENKTDLNFYSERNFLVCIGCNNPFSQTAVDSDMALPRKISFKRDFLLFFDYL